MIISDKVPYPRISNKIVIITGGTISYVRNHLALCAPAFGSTGRLLQSFIPNSKLIETKMANNKSKIITNKDIEELIMILLKDMELKCLVLNCALCDYDGKIGDVISDKNAKRLESREGNKVLNLTPSEKIISKIKAIRPDILLIGFKTTNNDTYKNIKMKAERMLEYTDIVFANDTYKRINGLFFKNSNLGVHRGMSDDRLNELKILSNKIIKYSNIQTK